MDATSPIILQRLPVWLAALRRLALKHPQLPGLYSLVRLCHHPDRRGHSYYNLTLQAGEGEPKFLLETRYFTDWQVFFFGTQDRLLEQWLRHNVQPNWVCLDVGANMGFFTVQIACRAGSCIAFEPVPRFAMRLRQNILINGLSNARVVESALSDANESGALFLPPESHANWGASSIVRPQGGAKIEIEMRRLDDFASSEGIHHLDLIKIDVEGAEHLVIEGGKKIIEKSRPRIIFENNDESCSRVCAILGDLGYSFFSLEQKELHSQEDFSATRDILAVCQAVQT